jgi:hypothetical protein
MRDTIERYFTAENGKWNITSFNFFSQGFSKTAKEWQCIGTNFFFFCQILLKSTLMIFHSVLKFAQYQIMAAMTNMNVARGVIEQRMIKTMTNLSHVCRPQN